MQKKISKVLNKSKTKSVKDSEKRTNFSNGKTTNSKAVKNANANANTNTITKQNNFLALKDSQNNLV